MTRIFIYIALTMLVLACGNQNASEQGHTQAAIADAGYYPVKVSHSKLFAILYHKGYKEIVWLNPEDASDTIDRLYLAVAENVQLPENAVKVKVPVHSVASLSSVFSGYIEALSLAESIKAIDNIKYVSHPVLVNAFKEGRLREVGEDGQINMELLAVLKPDVVFSSLFGGAIKSERQRFSRFGIPVVPCNSYMESDPLARAEWIKFFAAFYNAEQLADSLFRGIEQRYTALKSRTAAVQHKPLVMTEVKFGDAWNVPGGNTYTANLIADAGGKYVFDYKTNHYTHPLSIEVMLKEAGNADFWLNCGEFSSKAEILKADSRYAHFKPYSTDHIYNNNKQLNGLGGNGFWEQGPVQPDKVLSDLTMLFHPELGNDTLVFYRRLP